MKHLMVETNCIYDLMETNNIHVPECCKFGVGNISINCLKYHETSNKICPYLIFGTAKSTFALTDKSGEIINAVSFFDDLKLSPEEWDRREEAWIKRCNDILNDIDNEKN